MLVAEIDNTRGYQITGARAVANWHSVMQYV
jgi:hypothetical protein